MELIKEAVTKARASLERAEGRTPSPGARSGLAAEQTAVTRIVPTPYVQGPRWAPPRVQPDARVLERNRIVSFAATDPNHIAFNLLRTNVYRTLTDNAWRTLAITSPTSGCGKTMVAINLAFALARQAQYRTVLVDLDLKRSSVGSAVGLSTKGSVGQYLQGQGAFEDCFVQVSDNLILALNDRPIRNSAEIMHHQRIQDMLQQVRDTLRPDLIIFDLPPMLASDDAIALLPKVDSALLVIGAGHTTPNDVDPCVTQITGATNLLGVVLNKAQGVPDSYYYDETAE